MKGLILILSCFMLGCSTSSTRTRDYCENNWLKGYDSYQECYDQELPQKNKGEAVTKKYSNDKNY